MPTAVLGYFVSTEEAAEMLRAEARREGKPMPHCLVVDDPIADPPIPCMLTQEEALRVLDAAALQSAPCQAPKGRHL